MVRFSRLPSALASGFFSAAFAAGLAATSALDIGAPEFSSPRRLHVPLIYVSYVTEIAFSGSSHPAESEKNMSLASIVPLTIFVTLMLLASLQALSASGHFPKASRLPAIAQGSGPAVLWISIIVTAGSVVAGIAAAWMAIPWYAAVIGGGAVILLAPLTLQIFPDRIVDGKIALIGFAVAAAVLAALLCWLTRL